MPTILLLSLACAPDEFGGDQSKKSGTQDSFTTDSAAGEGELWTSEAELDLGTLCGAGSTELTLGNSGDGLLRVFDIHVEGEGWTLEGVTLPMQLAPGDETTLHLDSTGGEAELVIDALAIPLRSAADQPPTIVLQTEASSVDVKGELQLAARVHDAEDGAEGLVVSWASDLDGELGQTTADGEGLTALAWSAQDKTTGAHALSASVTDSCGQTVQADLALCQEAGSSLAKSGPSPFTFSGHAGWDEDNATIQLTDLQNYRTGSAFQTEHTVSADDVRLTFDFFIGDGSGADGLAVVALDTSHSGALMGAEGCGLGYGTPSAGCIDGSYGLPGWALEFDTCYNPQIDLSEKDHVALSIDGDQETTLVYVEVDELEDTGWHTVDLTVREGRFLVVLDGDTIIDEQVEAELDYPAWIGFTAASGGDTNRHVVDNLVVRDNVCLE